MSDYRIDFGDLDKLQDEIHKWRKENFPSSDDRDMLIGTMEELGELSHANLKNRQGIRDSGSAKEIDAIGDILIFVMGYCSYKSFRFSSCLKIAWREVSQRDWVKFPKNGVTE